MTVYVDDMRLRARVGRLDARWSHLLADDVDELHAFARGIGLRRSWFQGPPGHHPHYDVTDTKRRQAIQAGAKAITWREAGLMLTGHRPAAEATPPEPAAEPEPVGQLPFPGLA
jgi:Protein of unknown function (DUF4031)